MYTKDNIIGTRFTIAGSKKIYTIPSINRDRANISEAETPNLKVTDYTIETIVAFLNEGTWTPVLETYKIF